MFIVSFHCSLILVCLCYCFCYFILFCSHLFLLSHLSLTFAMFVSRFFAHFLILILLDAFVLHIFGVPPIFGVVSRLWVSIYRPATLRLLSLVFGPFASARNTCSLRGVVVALLFFWIATASPLPAMRRSWCCSGYR